MWRQVPCLSKTVVCSIEHSVTFHLRTSCLSVAEGLLRKLAPALGLAANETGLYCRRKSESAFHQTVLAITARVRRPVDSAAAPSGTRTIRHKVRTIAAYRLQQGRNRSSLPAQEARPELSEFGDRDSAPRPRGVVMACDKADWEDTSLASPTMRKSLRLRRLVSGRGRRPASQIHRDTNWRKDR
jgi:hypothetical protein